MARPGSRDTDDRTDSQLLAPNTPNESLFADAYNLMPKASDQQYEIPKGTATTVDNTGQHTATFGMNEIQNDLRLNPYTKLMGPEQAIADTGVAQYRVAAQECLRLNRPDLAVKNLCEELKVLQQFPTSQSGRLMYSALNSLADIALLSGDCNTARQLYNVANNCVQTYLTARLSESTPGSPEYTQFQKSQTTCNLFLQARINAANLFEYSLTHPQQPPPPGMDARAAQEYQQRVQDWQNQVNQDMFNTAIQSISY